ncbi:hypothetical protein K1T71_004884 [Dendrolimus kikuchii]|uniref:Uncharacterized protein n=1 Tax=Dendrolimus kikuchii TaxID=765133 RepID=A0ACC1D6M0_9NEOP|nr:hypothetical protein K1T71_004884 [Dendrolimus kikuchii]
MCAIELVCERIIVLCMYRVPKSKDSKIYFDVFFSTLESILCSLTTNNNKKIIICGDFNINLLENSTQSQKFKQIILSYNLKFSVNEPTRPNSGTCLDNIIHNVREAKSEVIELAVSDHKAQLMTFFIYIISLYNCLCFKIIHKIKHIKSIKKHYTQYHVFDTHTRIYTLLFIVALVKSVIIEV